MKAEKVLCTVALVLVIIGALNWGLEAFNLNLVKMASDAFGLTAESGKKTYLEMFVYIVVALSAVVVLVEWLSPRKNITVGPEDDHQA